MKINIVFSNYLIIYTFYFIISFVNGKYSRKHRFPKNIDKSKNIYILLWSNVMGKSRFYLKCPLYKECKYSSSRRDVKIADVLLFKDFRSDQNNIPKYRDPKQLYVYVNFEPKLIMDKKIKQGYKWKHKNFFNMTYTYSSKSDIQKTYYGEWTKGPIKKGFRKYYRNISVIPSISDIKKKNKYIVWTVSDCKTASKREEDVAMLKKFIPVNQFGACNHRVYKYGFFSKQFQNLYEKHYFYIALENSDCEDYISEKYFSRVHFNSIPIVGYRKKYEKIAPNNSFIAMDDFKSPKEMADYLKFLIKNKNEYLKYFDYRKEGWKIYDIDNAMDNFCSLCKKLVEMKKSGQLQKFYKTYYDAREAFLSWTQCKESERIWKE